MVSVLIIQLTLPYILSIINKVEQAIDQDDLSCGILL